LGQRLTGFVVDAGLFRRSLCRHGGGEDDSLSGMGKSFRRWDVDQSWLLPPSVAVVFRHFGLRGVTGNVEARRLGVTRNDVKRYV